MKSIWLNKYISQSEAIPSIEHLKQLRNAGFTRVYASEVTIRHPDFIRVREAGLEVFVWISHYEGEYHVPVVKADGYNVDLEVVGKGWHPLIGEKMRKLKEIVQNVRVTGKPLEFTVQVPGYWAMFGFYFINAIIGMDFKRLAHMCDVFMPMLYRNDSKYIHFFYEYVIRKLWDLKYTVPIMGIWQGDGQEGKVFHNDMKRIKNCVKDYSIYVYHPTRFEELLEAVQ